LAVAVEIGEQYGLDAAWQRNIRLRSEVAAPRGKENGYGSAEAICHHEVREFVPLRSPAVSQVDANRPEVEVTFVLKLDLNVKLPLPSPRKMERTARLAVVLARTAMSGLPSPSKSATASETGVFPTVVSLRVNVGAV